MPCIHRAVNPRDSEELEERVSLHWTIPCSEGKTLADLWQSGGGRGRRAGTSLGEYVSLDTREGKASSKESVTLKVTLVGVTALMKLVCK